jgi:hypothetical protein
VKGLVAAVMSVGLVACVSDHETLRNDRGQVFNCNNEGWGWIGAPVAMANQSDCIKKAEAAGFHKPGVAETATPPTAPAAVARNAPSSSPVAASPATIPALTPTAVPAAANAVGNTPAINGNPPTGAAADRLTKLDGLYKSGLITKDEYDRKRQEILSTL